MDFGRLTDLSEVDFTLPETPSVTHRTLALVPSPQKPQVFVGLPIWAVKEWVGKIYPHQAKSSDYLFHYTRQFNTIELNVTHYQIPTEETIVQWRQQSASGFRFCPKFPQVISHEKGLQNCESLTRTFCQRIGQLGEHLGMPFLQLPPYFGPRQTDLLEDFLETLPEHFLLAVEFRHPDWFIKKNNWERLMTLFAEKKIATVLTDVAGRRDVLHLSLPTPTLVLRWVGNDHPSDEARIREWSSRLADWTARGLQEVYIFVHLHDNVRAPEKATFWIKQLHEIGVDLRAPKFLPQVIQTSLFD
jgi:uncharacterized protein YecE (DUF72 family)